MELVNDNPAGLATTVQTAKDADTDAVLVERVKNGDMSAFDTLTLKYRERLLGSFTICSATARTRWT